MANRKYLVGQGGILTVSVDVFITEGQAARLASNNLPPVVLREILASSMSNEVSEEFVDQAINEAVKKKDEVLEEREIAQLERDIERLGKKLSSKGDAKLMELALSKLSQGATEPETPKKKK